VLKGFVGRIGEAIEAGDMSGIGAVFNDMIGTGVQSVQDGAPKIIKVIIGGLGSVQGMIKQQDPSIITAATTIILTLVQGQTRQCQVLQRPPFQSWRALHRVFQAIIQAAIQLLTSLIQGFVSMLPAILNLGLQLLLSLIQGIVQSIPLLIDSAVQIVLNLLQFITDTAYDNSGSSGHYNDAGTGFN
jgi:hypothetical protein